MRARGTSRLFVLGCLLVFASGARAQSPTTGQISGVVKDPSGAVVTGAKITLTNAAGVDRETATDADGHYLFPLLPPGIYSIHVDARGFQSYVLDRIEVRITEYSEVDAALSVARGAQSVTVTAAPPLVQTDSVDAGRVVGERQLSELPLPTRNYTQILGLSPGAMENLPNNTDLGRGDLDFYVNGQRDTSNNVVLDGTIITSPGTNSTPSLAVPSPDSLQEFIVQTSLYDATQGRNTGGNLAVVTKSGTNSFHGNAFEFFRNSALNANDYFLKQSGEARPELNSNQFGGTFGGPIKRDKTFFFISYQGTRQHNGASANSLTTLFIPQGLTNDRSTATLQNFALVNYGVTTIDPTALALLQATLPSGQFAIPSAAPNGTVLNGTVVTPLSALSTFSEDQFSLSFDQNVTSTNKFSAKFFFSQDPQFQALFSFVGADPLQAPGYGGHITFSNRVLSLTDTQTIGTNLINEAHFGFSRINAPSTPQEPFTNAQFGINNPLAATYPGMATIEVNGLFSIGSTPLGDQRSTTENFQGSDTLSWTHGKHFVRFGGDFIRNHVDFFFHSFSRGEIDFNDFTDFLNGTIAFGLLGNGIPNRNMRINDADGFVQDDWRILPNLTIDAGFRVGFDGGISDTQGRIANFLPNVFAQNTLPCLVTAPCNPPNGFELFKPGQTLNPNAWNVAPRIGLAWRPLGSDNFVVRTGYGIYYDRFSTRFANFQIFNYPYDIIGLSLGLLPGSFQNPFPNLAGVSFPVTPAVIPSPIPFYASGFPLPGFSTPISGLYAAKNLSVPYTQQYNLGFQWEPFKSWLLDAGYVGSKGTKLINVYNFNQGAAGTPPYNLSGFSNNKVLNGFEEVQTNTNSHYNALQASLTKRFSAGLQLLASYTYSKSTDQGSGGFENELGGYPGDQQNPDAQLGLSDFNRAQRFVISGVYQLPLFYKGDSRLAKSAANDWQIGGIAIFQSGLPFSVVCESGSALYNRADYVPGATITVPGGTESKLNDYFNVAAFSNTCANAAPYGTSGRNIITGPGQKNIDFSIVKYFPVTETARFEFRSEFFNLFNWVNFSNPNNNVLLPNVGAISTTSSGPRIIQFALKFNF
ncbi:MAG: TonB-dependent receptor [Candidatus Acidiferrales bacterium]